MKQVNIAFLKSKLITGKVGWGIPYKIQIRAQSSNAEVISKNVIKFTEYNELPVDGRTFDGHYDFYVNYTTFKYLIIQNSYYGGLCYTSPARELGWKKLNKADKKYAESIIASKLLGAYFYDRNATNTQGQNLFSTGEKEPAGFGWNPGIVRWMDGPKISLICKPILKLSEIDKEAITLLN